MSTLHSDIAGWMGAALTPVRDQLQEKESDIEGAITALVEQYSATLYRVAYSVVRNTAEAEDAVQETFIRVLRHKEELGTIRDVRVWLVRIVWNVVLDKKRRAKTRPETEDIADFARILPGADLAADQRLMAAQHHAHVLVCVDKLPAKEREVLLLSAFEELDTVQIAAILKTTESSVRSRLFRARRQLAVLLSHERSSR